MDTEPSPSSDTPRGPDLLPIAVAVLDALRRQNLPLGPLWDPKIAQSAYEYASGYSIPMATGYDPVLAAAADKLHFRQACARIRPERLVPVLNLMTSSPNGITIYQPDDDSYAIGFDQALFAWHSLILVQVLESNRLGWPLVRLAQRLIGLCDVMIAQRPRERLMRSGYYAEFFNVMAHEVRRAVERWGNICCPFGIGWCDFVLAHELAHIALGHLTTDNQAGFNVPVQGRMARAAYMHGTAEEFAADEWALHCCRYSESIRPLDCQDLGWQKHWGLSESQIHALRMPVIEVSIRFTFRFWQLIEDLYFADAPRSHPRAKDRRVRLDLARDRDPVFPREFGPLLGVEKTLDELCTSREWRDAVAFHKT
jgi:hypothetical protein